MINKFSQSKEEEEAVSEDISIKFNEIELKTSDDSKQDSCLTHLKLRQNSIASSVNSEVNSAYDSDDEHNEDDEEKIRKG